MDKSYPVAPGRQSEPSGISSRGVGDHISVVLPRALRSLKRDSSIGEIRKAATKYQIIIRDIGNQRDTAFGSVGGEIVLSSCAVVYRPSRIFRLNRVVDALYGAENGLFPLSNSTQSNAKLIDPSTL